MSGGNRDLHFHHLKLPWVLPVLRFLRRTQATTKYNWTLLSESFMYIRGTTHMNTRDWAPWMNHAHPVNSILWRTYVAAALTQKVVHWLLGARTFICVCEIAWLDTILFSSLTGDHRNDNWFCVTQRVDSWNDVALFFFFYYCWECTTVNWCACRSLSKLITATSRLCFRSCGYRVRVIGKQATAKEAPILIFSPHSSFLDAFVAHWTGLPCLIVRSQDRKSPIFGRK